MKKYKNIPIFEKNQPWANNNSNQVLNAVDKLVI